MAKYLVTVPYRGIQTYIVDANSAAEAKRKAQYGEDESAGVEALEYRVTQTFMPSHADLIAAAAKPSGDTP